MRNNIIGPVGAAVCMIIGLILVIWIGINYRIYLWRGTAFDWLPVVLLGILFIFLIACAFVETYCINKDIDKPKHRRHTYYDKIAKDAELHKHRKNLEK